MADSTPKVPQLERVNLIVTKYCNLQCRMCDFKKIYTLVKNLSLAEVKSITQEAASLGAKDLELSGGEPMTRKDIYEIISYAKSLGIRVTMISNGVMIGPAEAEKLITAGLSRIAFSLEGPETLNDQLRGQGNFQKTLRAIRSLQEVTSKPADFDISVGVTLSRYNYPSLLSFTKYLLEEVGVHSVAINPYTKVMMTGKNQKARDVEFHIPAELIPDLTKELSGLIAYAEKMPGKMPSPNYLQKIPDYFLGKKLLPAAGCRLPFTYCAITVNKWVYSCWQSPPLGNLNKSNLTQLLNSKNQEKICELALAGKCSGCLTSCYAEVH